LPESIRTCPFPAEKETVSNLALVQEDPKYPWYAVLTRSRHEQIASEILRGKGYQQYLPSYKIRRKWSDRVVEVDAPLFPGYVFCRFDINRRLPVLTTPGVTAIVGCGKEPAPIDEREIEAVRSVLRSGRFAEPCGFLYEGQRIRITQGALEGVEGILVRKKTQYRIVVSVTMLQRSVSVEVDREWIVGIE
jgi:transcription elongation factor/antiterminator RfaH